MKKFNEHENALWAKIEPYLDGCTLRPDAPADVVKAMEEFKALGQDYSNMQ